MSFNSPRRPAGTVKTSGCVAALVSGACAFAQPMSEPEAIELALEQGDFRALGEAQREEAAAGVDAIRPFANPSVEVSREAVSGSGGDEVEWQAGVRQTFDISGRRSSLRRAAQAEASAVDAEIARARQERIADVRRAYAGCAASIEEAEVRSGHVRRLSEAERVVTARANAGDTAVYDLRRLRVEARAAEAELALAEGEVGAECATLAALTGVDNARAMSPAASAAAPSRPIATIGPVLEARPDLVAREQRAVAASQSLEAARRARLPEIGVGLGIKHVDTDTGTATGPAVSVGFTIPLFDGGGAAVTAARARQNALRAELALAERQVAAEIAAASARSLAASQAASRALAARDDAARLIPIAETAYQYGEGDVVELVDAYEAARDAELAIIDLAEAAAIAAAELDLATGEIE